MPPLFDPKELKSRAKTVTRRYRRRKVHEQTGLSRNQMNAIRRKSTYSKGDQVARHAILKREKERKARRAVNARYNRETKRKTTRRVSGYSKLLGTIIKRDSVGLKEAHKLAKTKYHYKKVTEKPKRRRSTGSRLGSTRKARTTGL